MAEEVKSISFVRTGTCHSCRHNRLVYQCHRNFQTTPCEKKFCFDCLTLLFKDNITNVVQQTWRCPYIRRLCRCKGCAGRLDSGRIESTAWKVDTQKDAKTEFALDPAASVYTNLRMREEEDGDQSMRWLIREKVKKMVDFNGQLINKVNSHYHKLAEEEIMFYNKIIHNNLRVMNHIVKNVIANQNILPEQ